MKQRLDSYLLENNYAETKTKAQAIIMAGIVYINNQKSDKCGTFLKETDVIEVREKGLKYVGRGGLKLEKALHEFEININERICLDIGASTGGFTDCMLQNGAKRVYALDVGHAQLPWKLRQDERVINIEKTNIRNINVEDFVDAAFISADVSFISLKHIFPKINGIFKENIKANSANNCQSVCLIKPQFEAGRKQVGKGGIVRDENVHIEVINKVLEIANENELYAKNLSFSPICGAQGNIEYLTLLTPHQKEIQEIINIDKIREVVQNAKNYHS